MLLSLDPKARDALRRVLIHDQANRDAISSQLLRYRDERSDGWADIIDMLTMHPEERRKVARVLGEIEAETTSPNLIPQSAPSLAASRWQRRQYGSG